MTMGTKIRRLRLERKWTLEQLADRSGVDVGTISALELRASRRSQFASSLAAALGVSVEALLAGDSAITSGESSATSTQPHALPAVLRQPSPAYGTPWPFPSVSPSDYFALPARDQAEILGYVMAVMARKRKVA